LCELLASIPASSTITMTLCCSPKRALHHIRYRASFEGDEPVMKDYPNLF
jgi:hypothetical protein